MDPFVANTIQGTVHLISMFSYMNTISDFLFSKSVIDENEKLQLLPVANGIYEYIEASNSSQENVQKRKGILIKEVIKGSDIYGGKPHEEPDPIFVNELFKRIITSMVFDNELNIYAFILNTVRNSHSTKVAKLIDEMKIRLKSTLPPLVFERVFNDYILPMFPQSAEKISLNSVEFIYAQAGAMFVLSGSAHTEFMDVVLKSNQVSKNFEEYLYLAHAIEHLINAGKINEEFVKIFTLPALIYYISNNRDNIVEEVIANIVINPDHVENAVGQLFSYLRETISQGTMALDNSRLHQEKNKILSSFKKMGVKLNTLLIRENLLRISEENVVNISFTLRKEMLEEIKVTTIRFIDPGCELILSLSKHSFETLLKTITNIESQLSVNFPVINNFFIIFSKLSKNYHFKLDTISDKGVYIRAITHGKMYGYGYKFIKHPYAELRSIVELQEEVPVVLTIGDNNEKTYKEIDLSTGKLKSECHLQNRFPFELSENTETKIRVISDYDSGLCLRRRRRRKRSPNDHCLRRQLRLQKEFRINEAISFAAEKRFSLPKNIIDILYSYIFTSKQREVKFIMDWINHGENYVQLKWSDMYISNRKEFYTLMYLEVLDNPYLSEWDAISLLIENYSYNDEKLIHFYKPFTNIHSEFLQYRAYESMNFFDFYSLGLFLNNGYKFINSKSKQSVFMQQAIYRLGIRQIHNAPHNINKVLYATVLSKVKTFDSFFLTSSKFFKLPYFLLTTTKVSSALKLADLNNDEVIKVFYQLKMNNNSYFSACVNNVFKDNEMTNILFPETMFQIDNVEDNVIGDEHVKFVDLSLVKEKLSKAEFIKRTMDSLHKLEAWRQINNYQYYFSKS